MDSNASLKDSDTTAVSFNASTTLSPQIKPKQSKNSPFKLLAQNSANENLLRLNNLDNSIPYTVFFQIEKNILNQFTISLSKESTFLNLLEETIKQVGLTGKKYLASNCNIYYPKKSGLANEDFPTFSLNLLIRESEQTKFTVRVMKVVQPIGSNASLVSDNSEQGSPTKGNYRNVLTSIGTQSPSKKKDRNVFCSIFKVCSK